MNEEAVSLVRFLRVRDHDVLVEMFKNLAPLGEIEKNLLIKLFDDWTAEQAIVNLLFFPRLIPETHRYAVLLKALDDEKAPYYTLAAVVGLQNIDTSRLSPAIREQIIKRLLELIRTDSDIIASRASVTIWEYLDKDNFHQFLQVFPVTNETANRNILAYLVHRFGEYDKKRFGKMIREFDLKWSVRRRFMTRYKNFQKAKKSGKDVFMRAPVYEDIPNLSDVDQHPDIEFELEQNPES